MTLKEESASYKYAAGLKAGIKEKADQNKTFSNRLFVGIILSTAIAPVLVLLPESVAGVWWSKIIPAFLMVISGVCSAWFQLRKPHERWLLYRTAQREMEYEIDQYIFQLNHYKNCDDKDSLLADKISKRALELHYQWEPMIPKLEDIKKIKSDTGNVKC